MVVDRAFLVTSVRTVTTFSKSLLGDQGIRAVHQTAWPLLVSFRRGYTSIHGPAFGFHAAHMKGSSCYGSSMLQIVEELCMPDGFIDLLVKQMDGI